ncbi:MAG: hypothetical protein EZS28_040184 [Streblomastix strix]|uniref:Uncharacterized protein n=1 Tax=Streblomastix strix TaxID=222440 RepID=A0A5J4U1W6_9EUKA|nr:MAG: hypothetical protein EZS28_040184 [Streblomastix strix]
MHRIKLNIELPDMNIEEVGSVNIALILLPLYDPDCNLVFNPPPPSLEQDVNDTDLILISTPKLSFILTDPPNSLQVQYRNDIKPLI